MMENSRVVPASKGSPFFTWAACAIVAIVLVGFAHTFYLKTWFETPALPGLLHLHGLVMTLWFTLFLVQVRLIAVGRADLHRRVGVVGALLAALVWSWA